MPTNETPKGLRPFIFHGLALDWKDGDDNATGDCPFCGRDGKFGVDVGTGQWTCRVCQVGTDKGGGNVYTFLRLLWKDSQEQTSNADSAAFARERSLMNPETLDLWGVAKSALSGDWLIPGYGVDGKLNQLYKRIRLPARWELRPTPTLSHQLHGVPLYDKGKGTVYLHESWGNALAFWEALRCAKAGVQGDAGAQAHARLALTANEANSLYADANVLSVANCGAVGEALIKFAPLFTGKHVVLMFDSDHPKDFNGKRLEGAGQAAAKRAAQLLARLEGPPASLKFLDWGKDGHDASQRSGYDVRDALSVGSPTMAERVAALERLLTKVRPIPDDWAIGRTAAAKKSGGLEMECTPCSRWKDLVNQWRKAMRWTEGLDRALSVMLACSASTRSVGDQLWCKIIGPASSGKSTLCEAISVNRKHVLAKSTIRGFHSGYKSDPKGEEDNALVAQLYNKTLVTKDGDTLLQAPNKDQILAEARDLYDSTSRTHYRNKTSRDYQGVRMTWILCGTSALRQIDHSEVGERFLDCVIMEGIDDDLEDEINLRVANRAVRNASVIADGKFETQHDPDLVAAMQMTGGYVSHLCENAAELVAKLTMSDAAKRQCMRLAKLVAYMRARPSSKQDESAEREFSSRLVSQHVRLALHLAITLSKTSVDDEVMRRVRQTALDTSRGLTLEIAKCLYKAGEAGTEVKPLAIWTNQGEDKTWGLLRFLRRIGAVETFVAKAALVGKSSTRPRWRLTKKLTELYAEAFDSEQPSVQPERGF